jgi:hypothetical protein
MAISVSSGGDSLCQENKEFSIRHFPFLICHCSRSRKHDAVQQSLTAGLRFGLGLK